MTLKLKRCGCKPVEVGNDGMNIDVVSIEACHWDRRRARAKQGVARLVLPDSNPRLMFWHLRRAPVIGGQQCQLPHFDAEERMEKTILCEAKKKKTTKIV